MEYLIGSLFTVLSIILMNKIFKHKLENQQGRTIIRYSQSYVYGLVAEAINNFYDPPFPKTQSQQYMESTYIKVMIVENTAYWIKDNTLYTANVIDGLVDKDTTKEVDTMRMNKIELEKTMFVVEKLTEGNNDFGSPGQ